MAKGYAVGIASETKAFKQGIDAGVIKPLEDAQDELEKLGRSRGPEQLEDSMRDAQRATEKLGDETKEVAGKIEREFRDSYRSMRNASADTTSRAKQDLGELKNEAVQNASETLSSFDGSAQSIADGIQGTFGGLVQSLGPAGAVGSAAAAAGLGLAVALWEKSQEDAQKLRESAGELADELIETGDKGGRSLEQVAEKLREMATSSEEGELNLQQLRHEARKAEVDFKDLWQAMSSGTEDSIDAQQRLLDKIREEYDELERNNGWYDLSGKAQGRLQGLDAIKKQLEKNIEVTKLARETEQAWLEAGGQKIADKAAQIKAVNDAYDEAAGSAEDFIDEESGVFDTTKYIAAMEEREKALKKYKDNLAKADLSPEAERFLNEQGADTAALMVQGYIKASPKQREKLNSIWAEAAKENSGEYARKFNKELPTMHVKLVPDDSAVLNWVPPVKKGTVQYGPAGIERQGTVSNKYGRRHLG